MRVLLLAMMVSVAFAGKKKKQEEAEAAAAAAAAAAEAEAAAAAAAKAEAEAEAAAAEPEPPPEIVNADLQVSLRFADGSSRSGHVKRIERSDDFYGEAGWLTEDRKLTIEGEAGTLLKEFPWTDVKSVSVTPGRVPADVSCTYSTEFTPWMYDCTVKTTGKVVTTDGKSWTVSNRHKWRFTFDDDSQVEFWLYKFAARQQDETVVDIYTENPENLDLYVTLQTQLKQELKSSDFVTSITVQ